MIRRLKMVACVMLVALTSGIATYIIDVGLLLFIGMFADIAVLVLNPIFIVINTTFGGCVGCLIAMISAPLCKKLLF